MFVEVQSTVKEIGHLTGRDAVMWERILHIRTKIARSHRHIERALKTDGCIYSGPFNSFFWKQWNPHLPVDWVASSRGSDFNAPFSTHAPFVAHHVHYRYLSNDREKLLGVTEKHCNVSVQRDAVDREERKIIGWTYNTYLNFDFVVLNIWTSKKCVGH